MGEEFGSEQKMVISMDVFAGHDEFSPLLGGEWRRRVAESYAPGGIRA